MLSRRIQGVNPCAEHGRSSIKSRDPSSCLIKHTNITGGPGNGNLVDRARSLLLSAPYENPDWQNDPFWLESYPTPTTEGGAQLLLCKSLVDFKTLLTLMTLRSVQEYGG
jgi:hypothetical protein